MPAPTPMPPMHPTPGEPEVQFMTLWLAIRRGFKVLLLATALVGGLTWGALSLMAPRFTSESQLEFAAKRNNPLPDADRPGTPDLVAPRLDKEAINTHARALMAPDLVLRIADELRLRFKPEFNSALGEVDTWGTLQRMIGAAGPRPGESEEDRVLGVVTRQLEIANPKDSRLINVRFTSADPRLAADFANRLAEAYRASLVTTPVAETNEAVRLLVPKVEALRAEVLEAEAAVERYRATTDQFRAGPQSAPVSDQRMAGLNDELTKAEAARSEIESRWRTARELAQSGSAETHPDVQKSPLIQGLIGQRVRLERQVAEAGASLLPAHPRMQQLNADVAGLRRQINAEVQKVIQSLEKDYRSAAIRVESVTRQIDALKSKVAGRSGDEARLKELESTAKSKRNELERLQKQLEDNRTVVNIRKVPVEAQIISTARPSSVPAWPRKGPSTLLAMAATMILGLAFTITRALLMAPTASLAPVPAPARGPVEPQLVVSNAAAPARQPVPQPAPRPAAAPAGSLEPSPAARELAQRLMARTDMTTGIRTLVTADAGGIDPLPEAQALAETLSRSGRRVALVVWSLQGRGLTIARTAVRKPGMTELLQGRATFEQVIGRLPGSDVHIIQPGQPTVHRSAVLDPDRLNLTLDALDEAYEQIVVAGDMDDAKALFETLEGRFDAAIVVTSRPPAEAEPNVLLGYEVTEIDIVHTAPGAPAGAPGKPARRAAGKSAGKPAKAGKPAAPAAGRRLEPVS